MTEEERVTAVAIAMRNEGQRFVYPIGYYVTGEFTYRWEATNPDMDLHLDGTPVDAELEGWKILARVALAAINVSTDRKD